MFRISGAKGIQRVAICLAVLGAMAPAAAISSVKYTYDRMGRVTTALYDNGVCIVYAYDANGNRTSATTYAAGSLNTPTWGTGTWGCFIWTP
jgi:YD repeat-containing protein